MAISNDVIKDAGGPRLCNRMCTLHIYHSQNKLCNQGPSQLCITHRNAEKKENILIRSCFLMGSWEGSIISCYA